MIAQQTALLYAHHKKHPNARFYASPHPSINTGMFQDSLIDDVITHWVLDWNIKPEDKNESND